ncbi:ATP-grasp domain-containing protein [Streptomyces sp. NBC_01257]|uniref:ATP-grasp domain-containing protein n=1 Tax=Streptomyces sp. NBC_01257 TaxID=2903799 RepID=UPI002DD7E1CE|nr:ATP-grasp domain-containing protein [Streptomyces sp. NBC_01257]WRZ62880.1 ATP-grasp domain-containing protein [Streptomyces sp. NBC_01257]
MPRRHNGATSTPTAEEGPTTMPKLLLLEAMGNTGEYVIDAARDLDVEVVVVTHPDVYEEWYSPTLKHKIEEAGKLAFVDLSDSEGALRRLTGLARAEDVNGVVACWEFLTPLVAQLAAALGLPGNDPTRALSCRNKRIMARAFTEQGIPAPLTLAARTLEEAYQLVDTAGLAYPVVVKPSEQSGSWGVSVVGSDEELATAFATARSHLFQMPHGIPLDAHVIVQEYVGGTEFSIETVVAGGVATPLPPYDKFTTEGAARAEFGHTVPAELDEASVRTLQQAAVAAAHALGITNGIAHTELKLLPDGTTRIIELGARLPGDHIVALMRQARGIDEARIYVQIALGEEPSLAPTADTAAGIRFLTPPRGGVLRSVSGIGDSDAVARSRLTVQPGGHVRAPGDNDSRVGYVILHAGTAAEVNTAAAQVLADVRIEVA